MSNTLKEIVSCLSVHTTFDVEPKSPIHHKWVSAGKYLLRSEIFYKGNGPAYMTLPYSIQGTIDLSGMEIPPGHMIEYMASHIAYHLGLIPERFLTKEWNLGPEDEELADEVYNECLDVLKFSPGEIDELAQAYSKYLTNR